MLSTIGMIRMLAFQQIEPRLFGKSLGPEPRWSVPSTWGRPGSRRTPPGSEMWGKMCSDPHRGIQDLQDYMVQAWSNMSQDHLVNRDPLLNADLSLSIDIGVKWGAWTAVTAAGVGLGGHNSTFRAVTNFDSPIFAPYNGTFKSAATDFVLCFLVVFMKLAYVPWGPHAYPPGPPFQGGPPGAQWAPAADSVSGAPSAECVSHVCSGREGRRRIACRPRGIFA